MILFKGLSQDISHLIQSKAMMKLCRLADTINNFL